VAERDLSEKQKAFVEMVVSGENRSLVGSYVAVYGENGSRRTLTNEASRLFRSPTCVNYADAIRRRIEGEARRRAVGEREAIRSRLWSEADNAEKSADRLSALRMLGQTVDLFVEKVQVETVDSTSDADLIVELESMLRGSIGTGAPAPKYSGTSDRGK
tara:strand:- start:2885 stop:3361 length:477 start_codon:yes stop_codon:yes gene_type:complete